MIKKQKIIYRKFKPDSKKTPNIPNILLHMKSWFFVNDTG